LFNQERLVWRYAVGNPDQKLYDWLQAIDLSRVAISAALDEHGKLGPVGGMDIAKPLAAFEQAAKLGGPRVLIVSDQQAEILDGDPRLDPGAFPLRIIKAPTLTKAIESLYEDDGPRHAIRESERAACSTLELLDRTAPLVQPQGKRLYQELPLLHQVKKERLPRLRRPTTGDDGGDDDPKDHRLGAAAILRWEEELRDERVAYERHKVEEAFNDNSRTFHRAKSEVPRFVVTAPPGGGKTTLVRVLAYRAAVGELTLRGFRLLPARVRLRVWEKWAVKANQPESGLPEYLAEYCYKDLHLQPSPTHKQWRRWLERGDVLLLFDGLDEINGEAEFEATLRSTLAAFPRCPTIITCRTVSFEQHKALCEELPVFTLDGLDDRGRDAYVRAYPAQQANFDASKLIEQLNRQTAMRPLAANPLLLMLICFVVDDRKGTALPATRTELFDLAVSRLLRGPKKRVKVTYPGGKRDLRLIRKRRIVERSALELFAGQDRKRLLTFDEETVVDSLTRAVKIEGLGSAADVADALLDDLVHNSGLLRGDEDAGYFFLHLVIQEFLAASALARRVQARGWDVMLGLGTTRRTVREWVDKKAWDPRWREVVCMLTGRLASRRSSIDPPSADRARGLRTPPSARLDVSTRSSGQSKIDAALDAPEFLLRMLGDPKPTATNPEGDDAFYHRLALAATAMAEIPGSERENLSETISTLTARVFAYWWREWRNSTAAAYAALGRALPSLALVNAEVPAKRPPDEWDRVEQGKADLQTPAMPLLRRAAELLRDPDADVRRAAAEAVGGMGAAAATEPILDQIVALMRDLDPYVRAATTMVGPMGAAAATEPFLDQIVALMRDGNRWVGAEAALAVGAMGAAAATEPILEQIVALLRDGNEWPQFAALDAVRGMGAAAATDRFLDQIIALLRGPGWRVPEAAAYAVGGMGASAATERFLAQIAGLLCGPEWGKRAHALHAVRGMGAAAATEQFLAQIVALLRDPESAVRYVAAWAMGYMGAAAATEPILAQIIALLRDPDADVQGAAAYAVGRMGAAAATERFVDQIVALLRDPDSAVRAAAAEAVSGMAAAAATEPILGQIVVLLRDPERNVRVAAAKAVGRTGAAAATEPILDQIVALLRDPDDEVQRATETAVRGMGAAAATERFLDRIVALLRDRKWGVREAATRAVARLGAAAATEPILDQIVTLLRDRKSCVREAAARAVGVMGAAAATEPILDQIVALLRDPEFAVRRAAVRAVGDMAATAATERFLDQIVALLRDPDSAVRSAAARAVGGMGATAATGPVLDEIVALLRDPVRDVRSAAAGATGRFHAEGLRLFANPWRAVSVEELGR
jgi:HEAT repeat protein